MASLDPTEEKAGLRLDPAIAAQLAEMIANQRDYLEVFADRDFGGVSQRFAVGSYEATYDVKDLAVEGGVGADTISSLKMPNAGGQGYGFTVTLYADAGCRGASKSFGGDANYVGDDMNDKTSSIRITSMLP